MIFYAQADVAAYMLCPAMSDEAYGRLTRLWLPPPAEEM